MESLLVNLRKYRPRENTDPLENFITEAFAWLLRSNREVLQSVFECINNKLQSSISAPDGEVFISTQENFNNKVLGCRAIQHAENMNDIAQEQYGSRKNKQCN